MAAAHCGGPSNLMRALCVLMILHADGLKLKGAAAFGRRQGAKTQLKDDSANEDAGAPNENAFAALLPHHTHEVWDKWETQGIGAFDTVKQKFIENKKKKSDTGDIVVFGRLEDVEASSKAFQSVELNTREEVKNRLESYLFYPPHWPRVFCDNLRQYQDYLKGIERLHLGKCVPNKDKLPTSTAQGLWFFPRTDDFKKKSWITGGADYHSWWRLHHSCKAHLTKSQPHKRSIDQLPESNKQPMYIVYTQDAYVRKEGQVIAGNEHFVEAGPCYQAGYMNDDVCKGRNRPNPGSKKIDKIFVLGQIMGNALFHFLIENLPKIAVFLTDLLADPEIKILIVPHDRTKKPTGAMINWFSYLGIGAERIVHGEFLAKEVFIPPAIPCGASGERPWMMLAFRDVLLSRLPNPNPPMKSILLMRRDAGQRAPGVLPNFDQLKHTIEVLVKMAGLDLVVEEFSDTNATLVNNVAMSGAMFNRAKLIIGKHGAGFSNIVFGQEGASVIELWDYGNPPCFMDLALNLGMQHRLMTGTWGFFRENQMIDHVLELLDVKGVKAKDIADKARKQMPHASCCREMHCPCVACFYDMTAQKMCRKWHGISTGMPGCDKCNADASECSFKHLNVPEDGKISRENCRRGDC